MAYETCTDRRALALGALAAGLTAPFGRAADDGHARDRLVLRLAPGVPATLPARGANALDWEPPLNRPPVFSRLAFNAAE